MKSLLTLALLFLAAVGHAQTPVDRLSAALDSLGAFTVNGWVVSPDIKGAGITGDPANPAFVDAAWRPIRLRERLTSDSVWMRATLVMPEFILGEKVSGRVRLLVTVDDFGYLWIDGESKGFFPWDGDFVLTEDAVPGRRYTLAIKACNTGGPLRLLRAELVLEKSAPMRQKVLDLALSLRTGQKLLSFDTYQTNSQLREDPGIDKSTLDRTEKQRLYDDLQKAASSFDVSVLGAPTEAPISNEIDRLRGRLVPVGAFAKRFTLTFVANAHIDAAWLWRRRETMAVCRNTFASVLNIMNAKPGFDYSQSSAQYYDWMERFAPDVYRGIKKRIDDKRWEITGGMWIEPDCNLPSGESWFRQLLYGKRWFREKFGVDVTIGWNPDSFGYNENMPLFYANAGIDAFITQKLGWNDKTIFPYRLFWWEAPDGSRILTCFTFDYVNTIEDPFRLVDWQRQFEANTGVRNMLVLFGVGDHGGGPSIDMITRIERLRTLDVYPTIEYKTAKEYLDWLKTQDIATLPTWRDELYLEYHQGTFTTQAKMKERNRRSEVLLTNAEKFSSFATLFGLPYDKTALAGAWKDVMFNQFHDILPGSSIREVYIDANATYDDAEKAGNHRLRASLDAIAHSINTASITDGRPVVIFNSLSWTRDDLVTLRLDGAPKQYAVFDSDGQEIPAQVVRIDEYTHELLFIARGIPALGYGTYVLRERAPARQPSSFVFNDNGVENTLFAVEVDPATGRLTQITDKRTQRGLLAGSGHELELLEDVPKAWSAWNIGLTGVVYPSTFRGMEIVERGPVRTILRLRRDYLKPGVTKDFPTENFPSSFFTQDVVLYDGLARIDFRTEADWWEKNTMLKAAFSLAFSDTVAMYEAPYGTIARAAIPMNRFESAKTEVPAARWADVTHDGYGVALLNCGKYGYDIRNNLMRLSLLRSPEWPDPTADRGLHVMDYALYPHRGDWREADVVRRGYEYNDPLIPVVETSHDGALPARRSFVSIDAPGIVVTTIKQAEDDDAWVIQMYDAIGGGATLEITMPAPVVKAAYVNALEDEGASIACSGATVPVTVKSHGVVTVKVWMK